MIRKKILSTVKGHNLIEKDMHIVIGLSGGPDSVCLFNVLKELAPEMNLKLYPVHINHKFRPGAAEHDQAYVEEISRQAGFPCRSFVFDCSRIAREEKITSEEAGRKARYESFAKVASEIADAGVPRDMIRIAVAQNADDQCETILFRILRGSGTDGIAGVAYSRQDEWGNTIIRPLLDVKKSEILEYCSREKLNPCIDHTNLEPVYTRNKIRLQLIPYLEKEYNENIKDTIIRMGRIAQTDKEFLWQSARETMKNALKEKNDSYIIFDGEVLRNSAKAVRQRVISLGLKEIGLAEDVSFVHFEKCDELIFSSSPSARTDLPHGYFVARQYDDVKVSKNEDKDSGVVAADFMISVITAEEFSRKKLKKDTFAAFDYEMAKECFGDDFQGRIQIRNRAEGDFLTIGEGKTKKLQDFFVDSKVPKDIRDKVSLAAVGREILWIMPDKAAGLRGRYSSRCRLEQTTKEILCIEINC